jgi:hypothetical protein
MFLWFYKKREQREIIRLERLLLKEANEARKREIKKQITLCKMLNWEDYKFWKYI